MYAARNMEQYNGIPINLISKESLETLGSNERVDFVLNEVKEGKVLILEMGLSAVEEATLIEHTMMQIDHETFIGIEIQSYSKAFPRDNGGTWLDRLLKRKKTPRMAVIGPASLLRTIHKDGNVIQTMLVTREHVIENVELESKSEDAVAENIEYMFGEIDEEEAGEEKEGEVEEDDYESDSFDDDETTPGGGSRERSQGRKIPRRRRTNPGDSCTSLISRRSERPKEGTDAKSMSSLRHGFRRAQ